MQNSARCSPLPLEYFNGRRLIQWTRFKILSSVGESCYTSFYGGFATLIQSEQLLVAGIEPL
jgi:hypothetical protein